MKTRVIELRIYENDKLICGTNAGVDPKLSDMTILDSLRSVIFILQDLRKENAERIGNELMEKIKEKIIKGKIEELNLIAEDCPNCENVGWYTVINNTTGETEQYQCQWCHITKNSRFNINNRIEQLEME